MGAKAQARPTFPVSYQPLNYCPSTDTSLSKWLPSLGFDLKTHTLPEILLRADGWN